MDIHSDGYIRGGGGGGRIHPQIDSNMDVWSYTVTDIYGGGGGGTSTN